MKQEIIIDAKGSTLSPPIIRRALFAIAESFGIENPADFVRDNCLWMVPSMQWVHLESAGTEASQITNTLLALVRGMVIGNFDRTLMNTPVYRMAGDGDVLLLMGGQRPKVVLRITGLGAVAKEMEAGGVMPIEVMNV